MPRFHLELTGTVGSATFNSAETVRVLNQYPGKPVDVLIDSPGGSASQGLSIADAFRNHGDVTVHMRGICASAATVASMGAKKVTIAPDALYLAHKCSMLFLQWSHHNSDSLESYIKALQEAKEDLDTLDLAIARSYANRCKKPVSELLALMAKDSWITADKAKEWGFVDEITPYAGSKPLKISKAQAAAFTAEGLPLPPVPVDTDDESILSSIKSLLTSLFKKSDNMPTDNTPVQEPVAQAQQPAHDTAAEESQLESVKAELEKIKAENEALKKQNAELSKQPAASTADPIEQPDGKKKEDPEDPFAQFLKTGAEAKSLFDAVP